MQVIVSYYQAAASATTFRAAGRRQVIGHGALLCAAQNHPDVIRQDLAMEPEEFDRQFLGWLDKTLAKPSTL